MTRAAVIPFGGYFKRLTALVALLVAVLAQAHKRFTRLARPRLMTQRSQHCGIRAHRLHPWSSGTPLVRRGANMRLKIFLTLWLTLLTAHGAVPSYNASTHVISPTNLLKSNLVDSATVTWAMGAGGRMTATALAGSATVNTNDLRAASYVYVDATFGTNATAMRNRPDKPARDILYAVTNLSLSGDTIAIRRGTYTNATGISVLKQGIDYEGPEATIYHNTADGATNGLFDDRGISGGSTNNIRVKAVYLTMSDTGPSDPCGAVVTTNANTIINFKANYVRYEDIETSLENRAAAICVMNCQRVIAEVDWIEEGGANTSYCNGIYWERGNCHVKANRIDADNGYCVWAKEPAGYGSAEENLWVDCQDYTAGSVSSLQAILVNGTNSGYRVWIQGSQIIAQTSRAVEVSGGRVYVMGFGKIACSGAAVTVLVSGGVLWLDSQKISSGAAWLANSGGTAVLRVDEWEDVSSGVGRYDRIELTGGYTTIHGGSGLGRIGSIIYARGGTNIFHGFTADTTGVNTSTNYPVIMAGGRLEFHNSTLRAAPSTPNAIWGTNAQTVFANGGLMNTNLNSNITLANGSIVKISDKIDVVGTIRNVPVTLAYSGTNVFVDGKTGNLFNLTATNTFRIHATNIQAGATYVINVRQDGSGSRVMHIHNLNIATNSLSSHVLSTAANALDVLYWTADDTGTNVNSILNPAFAK